MLFVSVLIQSTNININNYDLITVEYLSGNLVEFSEDLSYSHLDK